MKINIQQLVSAVQNAPCFEPPEMNKGTNYLYDNTYNRLSKGEVVRFSYLDFTAFESEDISTLLDLYNDVYEKNNRQASSIADTLRKIIPISKVAAYV